MTKKLFTVLKEQYDNSPISIQNKMVLDSVDRKNVLHITLTAQDESVHKLWMTLENYKEHYPQPV